MYCPTRIAAIEHIEKLLLDHAKKLRRILIGFDFPYGYPRGFARSMALADDRQSWLSVWAKISSRVEDKALNVNNRFTAAAELNAIIDRSPGPYWGCPIGEICEHLMTNAPAFPFESANGVLLQRLRLVEQRLPGTQETWKLWGAGSVGSQALVGIPYLHRLRRHSKLAEISRVWPFETGFSATPSIDREPSILHAEIWPGVVNHKVTELQNLDPQLIRDQAQVRAMCQWAAQSDAAGELGQYFDVPVELNEKQVRTCAEEEGWIWGAR